MPGSIISGRTMVALALSAVTVVTMSAPTTSAVLAHAQRSPVCQVGHQAARAGRGSMSNSRNSSMPSRCAKASAWNSLCAPLPIRPCTGTQGGQRGGHRRGGGRAQGGGQRQLAQNRAPGVHVAPADRRPSVGVGRAGVAGMAVDVPPRRRRHQLDHPSRMRGHGRACRTAASAGGPGWIARPCRRRAPRPGGAHAASTLRKVVGGLKRMVGFMAASRNSSGAPAQPWQCKSSKFLTVLVSCRSIWQA